MEKILDPKNISALNFNEEIASRVDQIAQPLAQYFGISHFGFIRIYENGKMLRMANKPKWTRTYFEKGYYDDIDLYSMRDVQQNESRLLLLTGEPQGEHFTTLCKEFQIWNALGIYEKFEEYSDFWFFSSSPDNTEVINFYLNKVDALKNFSLYFKEKFSQEIKENDPSKLISTRVKITESSLVEKQKVKSLFNNLNINSYKLDDKVSLSKREFECLFYLVQGRTMKEIARFMNLSFRTIEFHLNNVKRKLNCNKKSQVIDTLLKNVVFSSLLPNY
jgi:DNA-binding CsgD family transcriptional regulator